MLTLTILSIAITITTVASTPLKYWPGTNDAPVLNHNAQPHQAKSLDLTPPPQLLLFCFDGLRADFVTRELMPFVYAMAHQKVFAPGGLTPQMWTVTTPNFASLATGMYTEHHGIIGNTMWDPVLGRAYDYWNFTGNDTVAKGSRDSVWYTGVPIWQANDNYTGGFNEAPRASGAMRFPTCDARYNNQTMKRCKPMTTNENDPPTTYEDWIKDLEELITWFVDPVDPINLGLFYIGEPDTIEHTTDIFASGVAETLRKLDRVVEHLFGRLAEEGLTATMNVIIVADHGHTNVYTPYTVVDIENITKTFDPTIEYIPSENTLFATGSTTADQLYLALQDYASHHPSVEVFRKRDIPDGWHYRNSSRIGDVVVLGKLSYFPFTRHADVVTYENDKSKVHGEHGFNKNYKEMHPLFVAIGPLFNDNYLVPFNSTVENIDVYPLMMKVLGMSIPFTPTFDGQFDRIKDILKSPF